ncbi:hypothetical protein JCM21900_002737 [Sporobolomyces salmonicolor]
MPAANKNNDASARASISKHVAYAEVDDGFGNGSVEENGDFNEEDEESEEALGPSTLELAQLVKSYTKSRTKNQIAETAKIEERMKELLEAGRTDVDAMVSAHLEKADVFVASLELEDTRYLGRIEPESYQRAFASQRSVSHMLVSDIDNLIEQNNPDELDFFKACRLKLEGRPRTAKRTKKMLEMVNRIVLDERLEMAQARFLLFYPLLPP